MSKYEIDRIKCFSIHNANQLLYGSVYHHICNVIQCKPSRVTIQIPVMLRDSILQIRWILQFNGELSGAKYPLKRNVNAIVRLKIEASVLRHSQKFFIMTIEFS
jgi:hypothetical protein